MEAHRRNPGAVHAPTVTDPDLIDAYFLVDHPGWNYAGSLMNTPERILTLMRLIETTRSSGGTSTRGGG